MEAILSGESGLLILLMAIWVLPWKGWAMWRAARRSEKKWFVALLILNTLAILEILYIFYFSKDQPEALEKDDGPNQLTQKEKNKQQIISLLMQKGIVKNDDVQKALDVSDATATRYLEELEKEGKIIQRGEGRGTYYTTS